MPPVYESMYGQICGVSDVREYVTCWSFLCSSMWVTLLFIPWGCQSLTCITSNLRVTQWYVYPGVCMCVCAIQWVLTTLTWNDSCESSTHTHTHTHTTHTHTHTHHTHTHTHTHTHGECLLETCEVLKFHPHTTHWNKEQDDKIMSKWMTLEKWKEGKSCK